MMVVVFGATGGLGKALVGWLTSRGWDVWPVEGRRACDIRSLGQLSELFRSVQMRLESLGPQVDPLHVVNCVAVSNSASIAKLDPNDMNEIDTNLFGVMRLLQGAVPLLKARQGSVLLVSSVTHTLGIPGTAGYSATKSALDGLARVAAHEWGRYNIRVNVLELGYFDAGIIRQVPPEMLEKLKERTPLGRLGATDEFCHAVEFCLTNTFLTGSVVKVNGGIV